MRLSLEPSDRSRLPLALGLFGAIVAAQFLLPEAGGILAVAYLGVLVLAPPRWVLPLASLASLLSLLPLLGVPRAGAVTLLEAGIDLFAIWVTALLLRGVWAARARLAQVVEELPVAMLTVDANGSILAVNRATRELLGFTDGELRAMTVEQLVPERLRSRHLIDRRAFQQAPAARPMARGIDLCIVHKDGRELPVEIGLNPVESSEGIVVLASVLDVSERKQFVAALEASNRELRDFAFVASHDLREPLRKVIAYGDILREDFGDVLPEAGRDIVERMRGASTRMQSLIDGLLEYSRIGSDELAFESVDLNRLLEDVLSDLELLVRERRVQVERDRLPTVAGNPTRLRQLFQNLIANAIKFQSGEREPRLQIRCEREDHGGHAISFVDNGVGFPPEKAGRLFRPFSRLHGASEFEGTGMGLALSARIASRHGWRLSAASRPGEGSRFTVHVGISESRRGKHDIQSERGHAAGGRR